MGIILQSLLDDYNEFEKKVVLDPSSDVLDLHNVQFITPTLLLPSLHFALEHSMKIRVNNQTSDYVKRVLGIIEGPSTTLPFRRLPKERSDENNELVMEILGLIESNYGKDEYGGSKYGGSLTLKHIFTEMINNVIDHSECHNAYTYAQKYPRAGAIDISFYDDGMSVPKSYEDVDLKFKNDCDAIYSAINGVSSKQNESDDDRGYGINTTTQLIVRGNEGSILIASRRGLCHINRNGKKYKALSKDKMMNGTLVSVRVQENQVQNFYDYMGYEPI